ncbi:MAG: phosphohistidine phosphatase [Chitinophagaceae bacterium]
MKTLVLIRHAKSSWENLEQSDFERPLNERGKKDAPEMAERIKERGVKPDLIVSSPAKRAKKTARYFAEEFDINKEDIFLVDRLYEAGTDDYEEVIRALPNKHEVVFLFAHNPTITSFANTLTNVRIDDMPTCSAFAASAEVNSWKDFLESSERKFLFFDYPKNPLG